MKPMIRKGARVKTTIRSQGMVPGCFYTVTGHRLELTAYGERMLYQLDGKLWVNNLPVLVTAVINNEEPLIL